MGFLDLIFGTTPATRRKPCPCGSGFDQGACQHRNVGGKGKNGAKTRNGRRTTGTRGGQPSRRRPSTSDRYIKPMGTGI